MRKYEERPAILSRKKRSIQKASQLLPQSAQHSEFAAIDGGDRHAQLGGDVGSGPAQDAMLPEYRA